MATTIYTPSMLRGAGTRGIPEIPVGSSFTNTYSMAFDGVDVGIDLGAGSAVGNGGITTVSFWIKGGVQTIPGANDLVLGGDYYNQWSFYEGHGTNLIFRNINGVVFTLMTDVFDDNWHHILMIRNPSGANNTIRTYKDNGTPVNITLDWRYGSGGLYNGPLRYIGRSYAGLSGVDGNMDEVAVWNSELSSADVATIYNSGTPGDLTSLSPQAWYRMGEEATWDGSDWTLTDQGSSGTDGTSTNMAEADRKSDVPS